MFGQDQMTAFFMKGVSGNRDSVEIGDVHGIHLGGHNLVDQNTEFDSGSGPAL